MAYNSTILHENTVKIKYNIGLSYKQVWILGGGGFSKKNRKFCRFFLG